MSSVSLVFKWGKFYPKKVIPIGGIKLSTQISDVKELAWQPCSTADTLSLSACLFLY